jgi:uncharacterized protein YndB with AHSA1/START domain
MLSSPANEGNDVSDTGQHTLTDSGIAATIPGLREKDIALSRMIEADSSRVFYALSIPEYIEAWLLAPDAEASQLVFELVTSETFQIDLYRAQALEASIHGFCRVVGANEVRYRWTTTSSISTTETLVDMKLLCAPEGCIIDLKHGGFEDPIESAWCYKMWHKSLDKLSTLMKRN